MPKCNNCPKVQSKLNQGNLCKDCFALQPDDLYIIKYTCSDHDSLCRDDDSYGDNDDIVHNNIFSDITLQEKGIIAIIKEHMLKQQEQQDKYIELLHN